MDSNYIEEQNNEIEVLESIFPDELEILENGPPAIFQIQVLLEAEDAIPTRIMETDIDMGRDTSGGVAMMNSLVETKKYALKILSKLEKINLFIKIEYKEKYPDEAPIIDLIIEDKERTGSIINIYELSEEETGIKSEDIKNTLDTINETIKENLGMAMTFTIISTIKENIEQILIKRIEKFEKEIELKIKLEEEKENLRLTGTKVTKESFSNWKLGFFEEIKMILEQNKDNNKNPKDYLTESQYSAAIITNQITNIPIGPNGKPKLTGKKSFEQDKSLVKSDVQFLQDDDIAVDLSEFEHLDLDDIKDLQLSDSNSDEEDGLSFSSDLSN